MRIYSQEGPKYLWLHNHAVTVLERWDELDGTESNDPERTEIETRLNALSVLAKDSKDW